MFFFRFESDMLAITDWNQRLSFYYLNGKQVKYKLKIFGGKNNKIFRPYLMLPGSERP